MIKRIQKDSDDTSAQKGFTLVEVLVALAIAAVVIAGIYSAYYSQQKSYVVQEQVVVVQQNLRAAMYFMEREIRMAGLDPQKSGSFAIKSGDATSTSFQFQEDISDNPGDDDDGDGNPNDEPDGIVQDTEDITYSLDGGTSQLTRTIGDGSFQIIAENIDSLDFVYLDSNGGALDSPVDVTKIRSVQIAVVARSEKPDPTYTSDETFANLQDEDIGGPFLDHFRHELLTAQVKCRNIGLN